MRNAMRFWDLPRGKGESCTEFGDFPWKVRNAERNLGFSARKIRNAVREFRFSVQKGTKIRSGFAILSLAAAKSPYHTFQTAARFPEFEGAAVIDSVSANFRHRNQLLRPVHSPREPFGAKPQTVPQAGSKRFALSA